MQLPELKTGCVYFGLAYEDDDFSRPLVNSYEYLGTDIHGPAETAEGTRFFFRFLGDQDTLELTQQQLDLVLDLPGLIEALKRWREKNPSA